MINIKWQGILTLSHN